MKAVSVEQVKKFTDIPNIGKAMESDFKMLGIKTPSDLKKKDAFKLYQELSKKRGRQDPCVLDTFMAAVDFMNGAPARPWWAYTAERKRVYRGI